MISFGIINYQYQKMQIKSIIWNQVVFPQYSLQKPINRLKLDWKQIEDQLHPYTANFFMVNFIDFDYVINPTIAPS